MSNQTAERARLRQMALAARRALSLAQRREASEQIAAQVLALPEVQEARAIALYLSLPEEVDTLPLLLRLREREHPPLLAAPVVLPGHRMEMHLLPSDLSELNRGPRGIFEPPAAGRTPLPVTIFDVILLPGVAFDPSGRRLGYGAGYYDRYLSDLKREEADGRTPPSASLVSLLPARRPLLVGLAFAVQLLPDIPAAPHDVPVDLVVTEQGIQRTPTA